VHGGRVAAQRRAHVLVRRLVSGLNAVHEGVWLGLLDHDDLQEVTNRCYADPATTFVQQRHVRSGPREWERQAFDDYFASCRTLLVAGAGSGREVEWLSRAGKDVTGFDSTRELVDYGNERLAIDGVSTKLLIAPPGGVPPGLGTFDGAVVGWGALSHIMGRHRRVEFLRALRAHVGVGAPLLVSCLWRLDDARRWHVSRSVAAAIRAVRRSPQPVELGDTVADAAWHWFTADELRHELRLGGFELVYTNAPHGDPAVGLAV
jgi:hypothetical protein